MNEEIANVMKIVTQVTVMAMCAGQLYICYKYYNLLLGQSSYARKEL